MCSQLAHTFSCTLTHNYFWCTYKDMLTRHTMGILILSFSLSLSLSHAFKESQVEEIQLRGRQTDRKRNDTVGKIKEHQWTHCWPVIQSAFLFSHTRTRSLSRIFTHMLPLTHITQKHKIAKNAHYTFSHHHTTPHHTTPRHTIQTHRGMFFSFNEWTGREAAARHCPRVNIIF